MTTTTNPQASNLTIDEFRLDMGGWHGRPLHFSTDDGEMTTSGSIESAGDILIRVNVDFGFDLVVLDTSQSSHLILLDVAIADLQRVRDTLAAVTPSAAHGRCMEGTDWGRCNLEHEHQRACEGPTEAQWRAEQTALAPLRARIAKTA